MPEGQQYNPEVEKNFVTEGQNKGRMRNTGFTQEKGDQQNELYTEMVNERGLSPKAAAKYADEQMSPDIAEDVAVNAATNSMRQAVDHRDNKEYSDRSFERAKNLADQAQSQVEGLQQQAHTGALEARSAADQAEIARLRAQLAGSGDKTEPTEQVEQAEKPKTMAEMTLDAIVQNRGIKYDTLRSQLSERTGSPIDERELKFTLSDLLHRHQIAKAGNDRYQQGSDYKG